jgi:N-acetylglucosamine kinase-like BadF-type ATPase
VVSLCLGMDIGGSGVRAALGQPDGTVLGVWAAGNLHDALPGIEGQVGWVVHVGLAGISRPGRRARALRSLKALGDVVVTSDAEVALWGALPDGEGLAVVAGTGSIALARDATSGRQARAGGYGWLLGDDGSAFWIGREAVRAALAAAEGRGPFTSLRDLATDAARLRVQELARLAPRVSQAATAGDAVARDILARAGQALGELAIAAARATWPVTEHQPDSLKVATCGGVWQAGQPLLEPFQAGLAEGLPGARITQPALQPAGGALLLACRRADPHGRDPERVEKIASARW